jgi:type I site-specific restriction endonuclease
MNEIKENISQIALKSNEIVAKLEILRALEEHKESISEEIKKTKEKLEKEEITKFTYATMQEVNQKNLDENTNRRKIIWNEIAETINNISDNLNGLKELYNQKTESNDAPEIK